MKNLLRISALITVCCLSAVAQQKQPLFLGVLEEFPETVDASVRVVRAMFQKTGADWKSFPSQCPDQACLKTIAARYPAEVAWTIAFDGKNLGQITGRTVRELPGSSEIGRQDIVSGTAPTIGKRSGEYGGVWDMAVYRPLVVVSQPNFKDPESWKPAVPSESLLDSVRKQFRRQYPSLCHMDSTKETVKNPWHYQDKSIQVVRAYSSQKGWTIIGLHLDKARDCSDEEAGDQVDDPWFAIDRNGTIQLLDKGITLIDAGDYDNDGKSEILFVINRYREGGFELFYDDFKKHAIFDLSFH
jgi:hypothetical protein